MGDLQVCSRLPNGVVTEDRPFPVSLSPPLRSSNLDPSAIGEDRWAIAEETTREVIGCIRPTLDSEEKRKDVIDYVQRLIRCSLGCEVFPYGSVPLKTYLPDGDIDLTALSSPAVEECLARDVLAVLQGEEQNNNAEYEVMDTQFIDAEVKLVKCLVQNIVIDISFNQLGGLCTLCFLEQVDRLVGKDHLFKRSILLIKTWCYYESRVLGAHHGLISTYALETLILYIFHLFHRSLNGPLAVLYRFLDYFSKFDWENFCISLKGPVRKSSLPDLVVEMPANMGDDLMLSEEFLRNCTDMFSVPSRELETNQRAFPLKNLNIIDPLKENNNLGRSVHRGNFYRICSAFKLGARKLGQILLLPRERTADEVKKFFSNTLGRHGCKFGDVSSLSHSRTFSDEKIQLNLLNLVLDNNIPGVGNNELDRYSMKDGSMQVVPKMAWSADGNWVSGSEPGGEVSSRIVSDASDFSLSSCDLSDSLSGLYNNAPCFPLSGSSAENGKVENEMFCEEWLDEETDFDSWDLIHEKMDSDSWMEHRDNHSGASNAACACNNYHEGVTSSCSGISSPDATFLESLALDCRDREVLDIAGSLETFNPLSDLSGDYDSHIRSLLYGQCCHGYALSALVLPNALTFPSYFQSNKQLDACSQTNSNGVVLRPTHNALNNHRPSNSLISEEKHKVRGTGTYFPKSNGCSCRGRSPQGRGRNQAPGNHHQFQRHSRNNGSAPTLPEKKSTDEGTRELRCGGKSGLRHHSPHSGSDDSHADGFSISPEKLQFGSLECLPEELSHPASETCRGWGSTPSLVALKVQSPKALKVQSPKALKVQSPKAVPGNDQERVAQQPFQLKNEDDFPPLTI